MLDWSEIILRLGIAALAGGAVGLNRDLHGKPVGVRTLALVSLATAMLTNNLDGVPVTAELGRLVGYVSRTDILRAVVADPPLSLWR